MKSSTRQMKFELSAFERQKFVEWDEEHKRDAHGGEEPPSGAIGGRLTFSFTPTSLGQVVRVACACGAVCDLTDYDAW